MEAKQQADTIVTGGVIVNGQAMQRADLAIANGVITAMGAVENTHTAARTIDARGKYVLPGVIDPHCHPVYADKMETFSVSAAFGGVTTVIGFVGSFAAWGGDGDLIASAQRFIDESQKMQKLVAYGITQICNALSDSEYYAVKSACSGLVSDLVIQARVKATEALKSAFARQKAG